MDSFIVKILHWYQLPFRWIRRLYDWTIAWADRPGGTWALFVLAFAESSFFPIPPDVLLTALCFGRARRSFWFAAVSSVGSVLGGIAGYAIGRGLWLGVSGWFIPHIFPQATFDQVTALYQQNAFLAVLTAAFTPIPYKVFTIAAGVTAIPLATLVAASVVGRSLRFFFVAGLIWKFGAPVREFIERRFELVATALFVLLVLGFFAVSGLM